MAQPERIVDSCLGDRARHDAALFALVHRILIERMRIKRRDGDTGRHESAAEFIAHPAIDAADDKIVRILGLRGRLALPNYFFNIGVRSLKIRQVVFPLPDLRR